MIKLIILLICIALQAFFNVSSRQEYYFYFDHYFISLKSLLARFNLQEGWKAIIGLLAPIWIILFILHMLVGGFWLLYFIYALIILFISLNIQEIKLEFTNYLKAAKGDNLIEAQAHADKFISRTDIQAKGELFRFMTEALFIRSLTGIFSVIFWFFLAGPVGAATYYLLSGLAARSSAEDYELREVYQKAIYAKDLLDWVPLRLLTLTYALIGHFGPVFNVWIERLGGSLSDNRQINIDCGLTAIQAEFDPLHADLTENELAYELVVRALWTWVLVIAIVQATAFLL